MSALAALEAEIEKARLRLPRIGRTKNPFKAGTSSIRRRVGRAAKVMGATSAFMAATPGTGYATGALGAALGGAKGAAIGFGAGAAVDSAITAGLGLAARRRAKLGGYLSRRSKRKSGVYKSWTARARTALRTQTRRAKRGLSSADPERVARLHDKLNYRRQPQRNLWSGKQNPLRRQRKTPATSQAVHRGTLYASPHIKALRSRLASFKDRKWGVRKAGLTNTSEHPMDAIDALYSAIDTVEKARGGPRSGMIPYGSRHQYGRAKFFEARAKRRGETVSPRAAAARGYLANRYRGGKGPGGAPRKAFYKSAALQAFDSAVEKARGMIPGGSRRMMRVMNGRANVSALLGGNKGRRAFNATNYLSTRRKGTVTGYSRPVWRTGKYK